jgi:hypothetical protein
MASTPVSEFIWTELERSFQLALNHLIKDIATTLGQSQDPLREALKGKLKIHLVEDNAESFTQKCTYLCTHPDTPAFLNECGEPVLWLQVEQETRRCPRHLVLATAPLPALVLTPLDGGYAYASDGTVYRGDGEACGFYIEGVLTLFEI